MRCTVLCFVFYSVHCTVLYLSLLIDLQAGKSDFYSRLPIKGKCIVIHWRLKNDLVLIISIHSSYHSSLKVN